MADKHSPTPWKACKDHEDFSGPMWDMDKEDEKEFSSRKFVKIYSSEGTVTTNHDLFEFKPGDAEFIVKACNEHEKMRKLLKDALKAIDLGFQFDDGDVYGYASNDVTDLAIAIEGMLE